MIKPPDKIYLQIEDCDYIDGSTWCTDKINDTDIEYQRSSQWISVENCKPKSKCLVYLEEELLNSRIHSAYFHPNIPIIGGSFEFDAPKVTHWMPLPDPPE